VRPAAGRPALPARRGRPLRQPHPPAARRGGGARPAEPPPPPADPPPVGGQGRDAEPPRRVPARALPLRHRARAARAPARADHRAPGRTVLLARSASQAAAARRRTWTTSVRGRALPTTASRTW